MWYHKNTSIEITEICENELRTSIFPGIDEDYLMSEKTIDYDR